MKQQTKETILVLILVIICCMGEKIFGQEKKWYMPTKKELLSYGAMAVSGVAKGYNEAIIHHHFGRGKQFWDKTISWQNKYKDYPADQRAAFIGSKGVFVMFTDGQHLTQALNTTFLITGTGLLVWDMKEEMKGFNGFEKVLYIVWRKVLLPLGIRTIAFELTFKNL